MMTSASALIRRKPTLLVALCFWEPGQFSDTGPLMWVMVCSTLWEWSTFLIISMKEFSFQLHISGDLVSVYKSLGYHHAVSDVQFHPLDHIIAFCSFGDSHPVLVYHYDPKGLFQRNMLYRVHTWLHLLVGTWKMMSQFSELYFTERPAKFKILFELKSSSSIWTQRHSIYLTNLVSRSLNTSGKNSVCNLQYGPRTRLIRGMVMMIVMVTMIMHMITKMLVGGFEFSRHTLLFIVCFCRQLRKKKRRNLWLPQWHPLNKLLRHSRAQPPLMTLPGMRRWVM